MPKSYFHVRDSNLLATDVVEVELDNLGKALNEALVSARGIIADDQKNGEFIIRTTVRD